jgi:polyhydroxybutyrate depolymerase
MQMNRLITLLAMAAMVSLNTMLAQTEKYVDIQCRIGGKQRTGKLFLPAGIKENAPVVTCVHGYGGSADPKAFDLDNVARREGFAVLYPQGLKDPSGNTGFFVGYPSQKGFDVNDVDMLCKMTRFVQKKYRLSKENAFLTGMSNGGDICYLAALEGQTTFKALAPVAGLAFTWFFKKYTLTNPHPVPLFEIHGTKDHVSEWGGDPQGQGGWGPYLPVPLAVNYWVARNGCSEYRNDTVKSKNPKSSHYVVRHYYTAGESNCDVQLYEVVGAPHCWHSGDLDTGEEIWKFFKKYVK